MLAQAALLDKAQRAIGADGPLVERRDMQADTAQVTDAEGVVQQQPQRLAPVALAPVGGVADADAHPADAVRLGEVVKESMAEILTVGLDGEARAIALALAQARLEARLQPLQRLRLERPVADQPLELRIIGELPDARQVLPPPAAAAARAPLVACPSPP